MSSHEQAAGNGSLVESTGKKSRKEAKSTTNGAHKRKRDGEEGQRIKAKKQKSDKRRKDEVEETVKSNGAVERAPTVQHETTMSQQDQTTDSRLPPSSDSPFHIQTSSLFLPLAPISQQYPLEGICAEHISPLILTYYPPFDGVVLAYNNARLSDQPFGDDGAAVALHSIDEYAVSWTWLTAEFLLFRPQKGQWLEGQVNLQNEGHVGLICWNLFNASIERQRLPADWEWWEGDELAEAEDEQTGYYVDADGAKISGSIRFRVKDMESSHDKGGGFLHIEGTMLDDDGEAKLYQDAKSRGMLGRRSNVVRDFGSTSLGAPRDIELGEGFSKAHGKT